MKMKHLVIIIHVLLFYLFTSSCKNRTASDYGDSFYSGEGYIPKEGFVPDEGTAIKIAEAIWYPIYGNGINDKKPFIATLKNDSTWVVEGSLPLLSKGGVPYIEINKYDCRVLKVMHGK